jgi:hypothetical protein
MKKRGGYHPFFLFYKKLVDILKYFLLDTFVNKNESYIMKNH